MTASSSTVRLIIAQRSSSSSTARRALPLEGSGGSSSVRTESNRTTSGAGSRDRCFSMSAFITSVRPSGSPPKPASSTARTISPAPATNSPRSAPASTSRSTSGNTAFGSRSDTSRSSSRSEEHTSELQSRLHLVCRLLLEKKKQTLRSKHLRFDHSQRTAGELSRGAPPQHWQGWVDGGLDARLADEAVEIQSPSAREQTVS